MAVVCGYSQNSLANQTIKWDEYTFKFGLTGQSAQVTDSNGKVVGTILLMNGDLRVLPLPGTDQAKLQKSFADWKTFRARSQGSGGSSGTGPAAAASESGAGSTPACPTAYGVTYLEGGAWKTMMTAVPMSRQNDVSVSQGMKDLAKNPLNPFAGRMMVTRYKEPAAPVTLGPSASFCIGIPATYNPSQIQMGVVDVKKDHREFEQAMTGREGWLPPKRVQPIDIKRISDTVVMVTPKTPLAPGQYVLGGPPMVAIYDFGVQ